MVVRHPGINSFCECKCVFGGFVTATLQHPWNGGINVEHTSSKTCYVAGLSLRLSIYALPVLDCTRFKLILGIKNLRLDIS
jgi:hypothetical protein